MISKLVRKTRTLIDTFHDFSREPLASFSALEEGLEDRRQPVPSELVRRVLNAYEAAKRDQKSAAAEYQANGEWTALIEAKLRAFRERGSMGEVLGSFFRNEDAFFGLSDYATLPYLKPHRNVMIRTLFVNSMLHDYRVWCELTGKKIETIRTPWAGNPFGYFIDGTLAVPATFRHHYVAEKAVAMMGRKGVLVEIGGGWGDVGFFALRFPGVLYVDIDLPEILLLASYWLCSTVPDRKIALYGEQDPKTVLADMENYDAILFPNFCLPFLPKDSADVFVNTRSLSEMRPETIQEYLGQIARTCRGYFLHENSDRPQSQLGHTEIPASSFPVEGFRLLNKAMSPWKAGGGRYREFLYERIAA
ncbi:MAG: putative sugar O-methyltransferase [Candidatus Sulfotelmatobacter sp.]|jgi:putative sugar O-methyltransferase